MNIKGKCPTCKAKYGKTSCYGIYGIDVVDLISEQVDKYRARIQEHPAYKLTKIMDTLKLNKDIYSYKERALFGMFLAIIIPPAKQNKVIAGVVTVAFILSFIFQYIEAVPSGLRVIILTVVISLVAAILFPVKEDEDE